MIYHRMKSVGFKFLAGMALTAAFASQVQAQAKVDKAQRDALVEYRTLFMKLKNDHNVAIRKLVKRMPINSVERVNQMVTHANALKEMAKDMMKLFPVGSGQGNSRALKDVWDPKTKALSQNFLSHSVKMQVEAEKLALEAYKGDMKEIKKQVRALADSCRKCHSDFRSE